MAHAKGPVNDDRIIVIGASAGGIEPLKQIVSDLPPDLSATVFVVVHVGQVSYLPEIL
uniref:chemotaxis protein CheB n=1 Tax=Klebsiella pneumoniae TaxID=573 RepID=UPI001954EF3D